MSRFIWLVLLGGLALLSVSCGPAIVVENKTNFVVRVIVSGSDGHEVVSPSPGESSTVEMAEGRYTATAIPDSDWIEYAKIKRQVLNEQLANADNLTGAQLLKVVNDLKEIALAMQQFEQAGVGASCSGALTQDGGGLVQVSVGGNGQLVVACR